MISFSLIFLYLLLITPLCAGISAAIAPEKGSGRAALMIWGIRIQHPFSLARDEQGRLQLSPILPRPKSRKGPGIIQGLRRMPLARRLIRHGIHIPMLEGEVHVGVDDAAATALLCGLLSACAGCIPHARLNIRPVFGGGWSLQGKCIARMRLGTLLAVCLLVVWGRRQARSKEARPWNIPSDT